MEPPEPDVVEAVCTDSVASSVDEAVSSSLLLVALAVLLVLLVVTSWQLALTSESAGAARGSSGQLL